MAEGEICTVFEGACVMGSGQAGEVIIKVVNDDADNGLARNEIRTLQGLHNTPAVQWKHLPFLLDVFETERRVGIILRKFRGFTLEQVRQHPRYRKGVDKKHMVWMLNRSLSALGFVHSQGYVHCNLCPEHVMVEPVNHNACLIDWSYSAFKPVLSHEDFRVFNLDFSAPEVKERLEKGRRDDLLPYPTADIYSLGKVMIWLLGGNPATNEMPDDVEDELQRFLLSFVIESKQQRPDNAWELHRQLISLVERLWGPRKYLQFLMD
jgi:serine/threonine protein kinase